MRPLFLLPALLLPLYAVAQQPPGQTPPPQGSNWQHVQALPPGAALHIKTSKHTLSCKFRSADADSLTCFHGKDMTVTRADVKSIKVSHRGRSALVGAAIGAASGAIVVQATDKPDDWMHGIAVLGAAVYLGALAAPIGALTDFTRSTVYKAP